MLGRMLGAARLKVDTFEDVEHDRGATLQALAVVIIVAIATGIGGLLGNENDILQGLGFGVVRGVLLWAVWALGIWIVGSTILRTSETNADWGQLARGTGFAQTPGILSILVFLPAGGFITLAVFFWQWAAMVVAVRQSLDYNSTLRAFFAVLIAAIPVAIVYGLVTALLGIGVTVTPEGG